MNSIQPFILASSSPRRQQLLADVGFNFEVIHLDIDETYPSNISQPQKVVEYIAHKKIRGCTDWLARKLVLTADTLVYLGNEIMGKPQHKEEAHVMLNKLANTNHTVTTSVCIGFQHRLHQFSVSTKVYFAALSNEQITYYVDNYLPLDKAGGYGIQEWIGHIGICRIEGSYSNVVGLPIHETYKAIISCSRRWLH